MIIIVIRGNIDKVSGFPDIVRVCKLLVVIKMFILLIFILAVFYILFYQCFCSAIFYQIYIILQDIYVAGRTAGAIFCRHSWVSKAKKIWKYFFLKILFYFLFKKKFISQIFFCSTGIAPSATFYKYINVTKFI